MATKASKKADQSAMKIIKTKATEVNKNLLQFTNEIVDETLANGEQWQNLLSKSLKKGTVLFGKQQDIIFSGLEKFRDQYTAGNKRLKTLFTNKPIDSNKPSTPNPKTPKRAGAKSGVVKKAVKTKTIAKGAISKQAITKTDLKLIEGIGPKIEELLNNAGIQNFDQLQAAKTADLKTILENAGSRYRMHDPSSWSKQANLAAAGKMDELKSLQTELKGGK